MSVDRYELALALLGAAALVAAWVPAYTARRPLSLPIVLVAIGALGSLLPLGLPSADPRQHLDLVERATELGVLVSLMGCGLKIDRPFAWRSWGTTWRMLGIAMPLTIAATAVAGAAGAGLPAAAALLLGGAIAPTDPVLASDVQVGEPTLDEAADPVVAEGDVRFTLTSEGGLNDALAFPFVVAALRFAEARSAGAGAGWLVEWLAWDVVGRVSIGLACGVLVGRLLGVVAFRPPGRLSALADTPQGFVAVAATLLAYGVAELVHGYGFLAVFVAAVTLRSMERHHELHAALHGFSEQTENLLVVGLLLVFGGALTSGVLGALGWRGALVAVVIVFVVRPAAGMLALVGTPLSGLERRAVAFFGIRGFGSIYYLSYALSARPFPAADQVWAIALAVLAVSIATHGTTATPMMGAADRAGQLRVRRAARAEARRSASAVRKGSWRTRS